jgi:outer membrane protein
VLSPDIGFSPVFTNVPYADQFQDNFGQAFGFQLDIPIFNNWNARTNISRSKINVLNSQLELESTRQTLLKDVQTAYQDAVAAKNSYEAL